MHSIEIICANSVAWMKGCESSSVDLIVADPPYNLGKKYGNDSDNKARYEQEEFTKEWVAEAIRLLKPGGSIYCFMGFRHIAALYSCLEEGGLTFQNWICWHYTQGMGKTKAFSPRHDDILVFSKGDNFVFNLDEVRVPQKYYRSINNMRGANPGDVWEFSHIHYCQDNRQDHPTQKPEGLIERIVRASSNIGHVVLDPFLGSGTTARVCQQLQRDFIGVEINPTYVDLAKERLAKAFTGFDSIDPRMKRVPLDLRDPIKRAEYVQNHIVWFLDKHQNDVEDFHREVDRVYGAADARRLKGKRSRSNAEAEPSRSSGGLFEALQAE